MKKLMSLLVAAVFAVSSGFAVAASHAGAPMKKDEMKKGDGKDAKKGAKKSDKKGDKKGAKPLHGPHQGAQKSTRTMSLPFTTCSKLSLVNAIVAMRGSPEICPSRDYSRGVCVP